jgi:hypothetical protein
MLKIATLWSRRNLNPCLQLFDMVLVGCKGNEGVEKGWAGGRRKEKWSDGYTNTLLTNS